MLNVCKNVELSFTNVESPGGGFHMWQRSAFNVISRLSFKNIHIKPYIISTACIHFFLIKVSN